MRRQGPTQGAAFRRFVRKPRYSCFVQKLASRRDPPSSAHPSRQHALLRPDVTRRQLRPECVQPPSARHPEHPTRLQPPPAQRWPHPTRLQHAPGPHPKRPQPPRAQHGAHQTGLQAPLARHPPHPTGLRPSPARHPPQAACPAVEPAGARSGRGHLGLGSTRSARRPPGRDRSLASRSASSRSRSSTLPTSCEPRCSEEHRARARRAGQEGASIHRKQADARLASRTAARLGKPDQRSPPR